MFKYAVAMMMVGASSGASWADESNAPRKVVPYCQSAIEHMCDIFVEFLDRDPRFVMVPREERYRNSEYLNIELRAAWTAESRIEGRIVWWGKSGDENVGMGAAMNNVPADPRVYIHLISLSLSGAGLPEGDSPFFDYGR